MADTLRDLVVSIALQTGDFNRNVKMVQNQMKELDATFKAAGAGVDGYEKSIEGMSQKASMLSQQLKMQQQIVDQLTGKYEKQQGKLRDTVVNRDNRIAELNALKASGADTKSDEYKRAVENVNNATKAMTTAESQLASYGTQLENAKARLAELGAAEQANNAELERAARGWADYQAAIDQSKNAVTGIQTSMQLAESNFRLEAAQSGIKNFGDTTDTVQSKITMFEEQFKLAGQAVDEYIKQTEALNGQRGIAEAMGDTAGVERIDQAIRETALAMNESKISMLEYGRSLTELQTKADGGWFDMQAQVENSQKAIQTLGEETDIAKSKFELLASENGGIEAFEKTMEGMTEKAKLFREEAENSQQAVEAYAEQIEALEGQRDIAESLGDTDTVDNLNSQINRLTAEMNRAQAEANNLNRQADVLDSTFTQLGSVLTEVGDRMIKVGDGMKRFGDTWTKNITNPIKEFATGALDAAKDFETAMSTVKKAYMGESQEVYEGMAQYAKDMSEVMGMSANDIASVMNMVGQMGIDASAYQQFTDVVLKLGTTTDMGMEEIAKSLAQYTNITGMNLDNMSNLGSTIEYLGVNMQTTEADIISMATALAAAGSQVGLTDAEILGMASTLSSVGISAQKGGTAFSKALINMEVAVVDWEEAIKEGKDTTELELNDFAKIAGMTSQEFADVWRSQGAITPFSNFINGVAQMSDEGISAIATLDKLGITEVRLRDTMLRTVNANELFNKSIRLANQAWQENTALNDAANTILDTTATRVENLKNKFTNMKITIGDDLKPAYDSIIESLSGLLDKFDELDAGTRKTIEFGALGVAAIGPIIAVSGKLIKAAGVLTKGIGGVMTALGSGQGLISALTATGGGTLALVAAIAALAAGVVVAAKKVREYRDSLRETYQAEKDLSDAAERWKDNITTGFETAKGLGAFGIDTALQFDIKFDPEKAKDDGKKTGNAWLDGLVEVWTDGQKETDEILNTWVTNSGIGDLQKKITESTSGTSESREKAVKDLDGIQKKIQEILKNKQNRLLTDSEIKQLNDLWGQAHEIGLQFNIELTGAGSGYSDLNSLFDGIQTGVEAALARKAKGGSVWENAFAGLTDGYSQYMDQLNKTFDEEYAKIVNNSDLSITEKDSAIQALVQWYNDMGTQAGTAYQNALVEAMNSTGVTFETGDEVYGDTVDKLQQINQILGELESGGSLDDTQLSELMTLISELDETQVVELETALTALGSSAATAGLDLKDVNENAAALDTTLSTLKTFANGDYSGLFGENGKGVWDSLKSMFGKENDAEVLEVTASLNADELENSYTAWATTGEHTPITAPVEPTTPTGLTFNTNGWNTVTDASGGKSFFDGGMKLDASGKVIVVDGAGLEIGSVSSIKLDNIGSTISSTGTDSKSFELPIESIDLVVTKGNVTGIEYFSADGSALSNPTDADGNPLTIEKAIELLGQISYGDITLIDDGTEIEAPIRGVFSDFEVPEGVEIPPVTVNANLEVGNMGGKMNQDTYGDDFFGAFDSMKTPAEVLQQWVEQSKYFDPSQIETGTLQNATADLMRQLLTDTFVGLDKDKELNFGEMYFEYLSAALQSDGSMNADVADTLMGTLSNVMKIVDPSAVQADDRISGMMRSMLIGAMFGDDADANDPEIQQKLYTFLENTQTELSQKLQNYEPPEEKTSFWDWLLPSAEASEMPGGDDSLAGQIENTIHEQVNTATDEIAAAGYGDQIMSGILGGSGEGAAEGESGIEAAMVAALVNALTAAGSDPTVAAAAQEALSTAMSQASAGGAESDTTGISAQVAAQLAAALTAAGMDASVTAAGAAAVASALSSVNAGSTEGGAAPGGGSEGGGLSAKIAAQLAAALTAAGSDPTVAAAGATAFTTALSSVGGGEGGEGGDASGLSSSVASYLSGAITNAGSDGSVSSAAASAISAVYGYLSSEGGKGYSGDFGIGATLSSAVAQAHVTGTVDISGITTSGADSIGAQIARGIASGITANTGAIRSAAASAARAALAAAKSTLGIHSPSRVFRDEVGANIMKGIGVGVTQESRNQAKVVANAMRYLTKTASGYGVGMGAGAGGTYATNNYNDSSSVNIYGNFSVRDDRDVRELAREISTLTKSSQAGKGVR